MIIILESLKNIKLLAMKRFSCMSLRNGFIRKIGNVQFIYSDVYWSLFMDKIFRLVLILSNRQKITSRKPKITNGTSHNFCRKTILTKIPDIVYSFLVYLSWKHLNPSQDVRIHSSIRSGWPLKFSCKNKRRYFVLLRDHTQLTYLYRRKL